MARKKLRKFFYVILTAIMLAVFLGAGLVAYWSANLKIPDINSGFRIIKKSELERFSHLYPNKFSITTTSTLAFMNDGLSIKYVPITINPRDKNTGKSTVRFFKDGFQTILLILRIIMFFNPLRIFVPASALLFLGGSLFSLYGLYAFGRFPTSGAVVIIASLILFFNGLLADQISLIRRRG